MRPAPALLLALVMTPGCGGGSDEEERAQEVPSRLQPGGAIKLSSSDGAALGLAVEAATEGDLPDVALYFGKVFSPPGTASVVVAPVAGRVTRAPLVALGDTVKGGQILVLLTPVLGGGERITLGVQGAELAGQIEAARRELSLREVELVRARDLAASKIISTEKLQQAETAVATTRARLDSMRRAADVQQAGVERGSVELRAPTSGQVASLAAVVGAVVQPGDVLARIVQAGPRWIEVAVPPPMPTGAFYEVEAGAAWVPARLLAPGGVVDDDGARHDRLEVAAPEAAGLLTGATVPVHIARGNARGVLVPESALAPGVSGDTVFIESGADTFTPRTVRVGARFGGKARIEAGLHAGERVVVRGAMALRGELVRSQLRHQE